MDHLTYLERYHELTSANLAVIAQKLGSETAEAVTEGVARLTALRAAQDALWEQRRAQAEREVNP
jgi:two-component sensor histidine kinase